MRSESAILRGYSLRREPLRLLRPPRCWLSVRESDMEASGSALRLDGRHRDESDLETKGQEDGIEMRKDFSRLLLLPAAPPSGLISSSLSE